MEGEGETRTDWKVTISHTEPYTDDRAPPPTAKQLAMAAATGKPYSADGDDMIKVVVLGSPGVGKTSIIQQFVWKSFTSSYYPTSRKEHYYPTVVCHGETYSLKITDVPEISTFATNMQGGYHSGADLQGYGMSEANAYVLVYDLLNPDSFEYISNVYSALHEARELSHLPVMVVGNKTDKVSCTGASARDRYDYASSKYRTSGGSLSSRYADEYEDFGHHGHHHGGGGHDDHDVFRTSLSGHGHDHGYGGHHGGHHGYGHSSHKDKYRDKYRDRHGYGSSHSRYDKYDKYGHHRHSNGHSKHKSPKKTIFYYEEGNFLEPETAERVKGEWGATYKESSARDPESVEAIFKSLMNHVDEHGVEKPIDDDKPKNCAIL